MINPENDLAKYRLGQLLLSLKKYHEAIELLLAIKVADPVREGNRLWLLAESYQQIGKQEKAILFFNKALRLANDTSDIVLIEKAQQSLMPFTAI